MRIAYIILAHDSPALLRRTITRLNCPGATFFVHIDRRSRLEPFTRSLRDARHCDIYFVKRVASRWGGYGLVKATLNALAAVAAQQEEYSYTVLLSGRDYPIRRANEIVDVLADSNGVSFIEAAPFGPDPHLWERRYRFECLHFRAFGRQLVAPPYSPPRSPGLRVLAALAGAVLKQRRHPPGLTPYFGSQWWALPPPAVVEILQRVDEHPDFLRFHRYSHMPDAMVFQTILMNSRDDSVVHGVVNSNLHYMDWNRVEETADPLIYWDWSKPSLSRHPKCLSDGDYERIQESGKLFARKFDEVRSDGLLERLDVEIHGCQPQSLGWCGFSG